MAEFCKGLSSVQSCSLDADSCLMQKWDERHTSENDPVGSLPCHQTYAIFLVADGGVDLESFEVRSMAEARSVLLQVPS